MKACRGRKITAFFKKDEYCPLADICYRSKNNKELRGYEVDDSLYAYDKVNKDCPNYLNSAQWRVVKMYLCKKNKQ